MSASSARWPWFDIVEGNALDQGDILANCPIFVVADIERLDLEKLDATEPAAAILTTDVVIMTQTCDIVNSNVESLVLCPVWSVATFVLSEPEFRKQAEEVVRRASKGPLPVSGVPEFDRLVWDVIKQNKGIKKNLDSIAKGERPGYVMLPENPTDPIFPQSMVSFHEIYSQPKAMLEKVASERGRRLRLRSPYREHLSQAFGRYFMRIGLPIGIPRLA